MEALGKFIGRMKRIFKVALCGYYGFGNLGDELLAEALVKLLEKQGVARSEIVILSSAPDLYEKRFGIKSIRRDDPAALWGVFRRTDSLLLGGGGLFQDVTSFRSCLYYWAVVRMAKLAGCSVWAFGNSIGPLKRKLSAYLTTRAYKACDFVAVRDQKALTWIRDRGIVGYKIPDPVIYLWNERMLTASMPIDNNRLLVNFRPWNGVLERQGAEAVSSFARERGLSVIGVALSEEDRLCMEEIHREGIIAFREIKRIATLDDVLEVMGSGEMAVGMRLHFCVLSLMSGFSPTAIPYDPKVREFAAEWGLPLWERGRPLRVLPKEDATIRNKLVSAKDSIEALMTKALNQMIG